MTLSSPTHTVWSVTFSEHAAAQVTPPPSRHPHSASSQLSLSLIFLCPLLLLPTPSSTLGFHSSHCLALLVDTVSFA